jgi:eukaryotic-like serine/threonine-protein kinase
MAMVAPLAPAGTRSLPALAKYDVIEEIGHGGMATVYRAMDKRLAREVAVKVIHPHLRESAEVAHRFVVEAQAVAKLRHPNIVEVFDVSAEDDPEKFLVVELVRGATLRKLLKERAPLPPEIASSLAVELLAALSHAHTEGVVHRDVKPENVLIEHRAAQSTGDTPAPSSGNLDAPRVRVKLTDFGIAKLLDAQGVTSTGQVLGSPAHMAPEQIEGGAVDARADVFGMGVLLYEAMVGHLPFEGQNPAQVLRRVLDGQYPSAEVERPTVGKRLSVILDRALAHDPAARFESATAMRDALLAELRRVGIDSPPRELEAYFDDPEGYANDHKKRTIAKLCELAAEARKDSRVLDAADDYNRALAYAPDDPQLLRIVSGMQRDAARARMLRRAGPLALATVVVAVLAYFVTQSLKNHPTRPIASASTTTSASATVSGSATSTSTSTGTSTVAATGTATSTATSTVAATSTGAGTGTSTGTAAAHVERTVTLTVSGDVAAFFVSIDGRDAESKTTGDTIRVDEREHALRFSCAQDLCEAQSRKVAAGKGDETVLVELRSKPATLIVDGPPGASYSIDGYAGLVIKSGTPVNIKVPPERFVMLRDLSNPARQQKVDVERGQQVKVKF